MAENGKSNNNRLQVCRVIDVPLHEVSGICLRRGRNGRMHLIAVGDRVAKIAWFSLPRSDGGRIDWHTSDIEKLLHLYGPLHIRRGHHRNKSLLARILSIASGAAKANEAEDPKIAEYQLLASGRALIGVASPDAHLHAETLARDVWDPDRDPELAGIGAIVAVHRLREVACIYGFTRFEPAPLANDDLEDVGLAVRGAPLGQSPDWLPAVEQFGEGVFIQFSPEALASWLGRPTVLRR